MVREKIRERREERGERREKRRPLSSLFSSLSFLLSLFFISSCQFQVPQDPYTFVQHLPADPEVLNPVTSTSAYSQAVEGFIFESFFEIDNETLGDKPALATHWEISKDHLQYTLHLRPDVLWHDGKPFTAEDVLYTYEKIQDSKVDAAPLRSYFVDIRKVEKLDDHTVRFGFKRPNINAMFTLGLLKPIPKHIFDDGHEFNSHPLNRKPIGTGPFRFVEWRTGRKIVLERFEGYWGKPYHIQKVVFKLIPDDLTAFQLLKKGELDLMNLRALQWVVQTSSKKFSEKFSKHKYFTPFGSYSYIGWNLRKPFFQDRKVRLALAHLIDRKKINEKLLYGLNHLITGPYYPWGKIYDGALKPVAYDLEKAKQLLEEAGWRDEDGDGVREKNGVAFRFQFLFSSGVSFYEQLMPMLRLDYAKAGIQIDLSRLDGITMFKLIHDHDFDAYVAAWGRGTDVNEDLYQIWHSSQIKEGSNYIGFANSEVDRLLEAGRLEFNESKRIGFYQRTHQILHTEQPYCFLFTGPTLVARHSRFKNVKVYPVGFDYREWEVE